MILLIDQLFCHNRIICDHVVDPHADHLFQLILRVNRPYINLFSCFLGTVYKTLAQHRGFHTVAIRIFQIRKVSIGNGRNIYGLNTRICLFHFLQGLFSVDTSPALSVSLGTDVVHFTLHLVYRFLFQNPSQIRKLIFISLQLLFYQIILQ